jgi:hypothetical protein
MTCEEIDAICDSYVVYRYGADMGKRLDDRREKAGSFSEAYDTAIDYTKKTKAADGGWSWAVIELRPRLDPVK